MNIRTVRQAIPVVAAALLFPACRKGDPAAAGMGEVPPTVVTVAQPVVKPVTEWDEFTGRIEASESVELYSQVTGYLQSVHFTDGSEVKKGDLLFQIDPRPFQAVLDQAKAQQAQAQVRLDLAVADYERAKKLVATRAISTEDYDTRAKAVREAEAGLLSATAAVERAALDLEYSSIRAPLDGRIGRKLMDVGGLVIGGPMGATLLTTIVKLDPIYCYIDADELSVLRYQRLNREGSGPSLEVENRIPCELALADSEGFPFRGVIDFVDNRMDPGTGTIKVRAVFENPKPPRGQRVLQPGYFARVRVPGSAYEATLVDDKAIGSSQAQKIVMVVGPDNIAQPRPVTLGPVQADGMRIVRSGITPEDRVIVNGLAKVRPGMPVQPVTAEQAQAAATTASNAR